MGQASVAATAPSHHVIILFKDNILIIIKVEEVDGEEFVWDTAGAADVLAQFEGVDDGLHCGVVRWSHVLAQGEGTGSFTVICIVAFRGDYPS